MVALASHRSNRFRKWWVPKDPLAVLARVCFHAQARGWPASQAEAGMTRMTEMKAMTLAMTASACLVLIPHALQRP